MVPKDNSVRYPHVVSLALDDDNDKVSVMGVHRYLDI